MKKKLDFDPKKNTKYRKIHYILKALFKTQETKIIKEIMVYFKDNLLDEEERWESFALWKKISNRKKDVKYMIYNYLFWDFYLKEFNNSLDFLQQIVQEDIQFWDIWLEDLELKAFKRVILHLLGNQQSPLFRGMLAFDFRRALKCKRKWVIVDLEKVYKYCKGRQSLWVIFYLKLIDQINECLQVLD